METRYIQNICNRVKEFKSYYVVWKLVDPPIEEENDDLFKSYYVVWKPFPSNPMISVASCLNRTM